MIHFELSPIAIFSFIIYFYRPLLFYFLHYRCSTSNTDSEETMSCNVTVRLSCQIKKNIYMISYFQHTIISAVRYVLIRNISYD